MLLAGTDKAGEFYRQMFIHYLLISLTAYLKLAMNCIGLMMQ